MKGEDLKKRLKETSITMSEIANRLGILPQTLYSAFNADDVKSGLLEKLSEALNVPISFFYGDAYTITGNNIVNSGDNNAVNASDDRLISLLMSKDEQLTIAMRQTEKAQGQIDRLLNIIESR